MSVKTVPVFNKNGRPNRQVSIAGRDHTRRPGWGYIDLRNNQGERTEGDWEAIKALIAAGDVAIPLTPWEGDSILGEFEGKVLDAGPNVDLQPPRAVRWVFIADGVKGHFYAEGRPEWFCAEHDEQMYDHLAWGRHRRNKHPEEGLSQNPETVRRREERAAKMAAKGTRKPKRTTVKRAERRAAQKAVQAEQITHEHMEVVDGCVMCAPLAVELEGADAPVLIEA